MSVHQRHDAGIGLTRSLISCICVIVWASHKLFLRKYVARIFTKQEINKINKGLTHDDTSDKRQKF